MAVCNELTCTIAKAILMVNMKTGMEIMNTICMVTHYSPV